MINKFFVLTLLVVAAFADDFKEEDGVLVLTKDTFDAAIEKHEYVLAEFCEFCVSLKIFRVKKIILFLKSNPVYFTV